MRLYINRFFLGIVLLNLVTACDAGDKTMFFKGAADSQLERAIIKDDVDAVAQAIKQGANPNAVGLHGVTPIIVTAGNLKFNAMKALIKAGANPNTYDNNGDNAVTLAATTYRNDKRYLEYLLDNGGDPNSRLPGGNPVFKRIAILHDLDAIDWIISKGADVNDTSYGVPLIFYYAKSNDWDTAWILMELGANYHFTNPRFNWFGQFYSPIQAGPSSPLFEYKEKVWRKLCESGIEVPPLTSKEGWEYKIKWGGEMALPPDQMPIITCDNKNHKVIGKWGTLKPKVKSAYESLKEVMPKGAVQKGSLSNEKLISDTMKAAAVKVSSLGCNRPETMQAYVLTMPIGEKNIKVWKELWIIKGCGKTYQLKIKFIADGVGATYVIEK